MSYLVVEQAKEADREFLYEAVRVTLMELHALKSDPYVKGFSSIHRDDIHDYIDDYFDTIFARSYLLFSDGKPIGCIMGKITKTNLSASGLGFVGWIGECYVQEAYRKRGYCKALFEALQQWFKSKRILHIELSYMAANTQAAESWEALGFQPFRVLAYKQINERE